MRHDKAQSRHRHWRRLARLVWLSPMLGASAALAQGSLSLNRDALVEQARSAARETVERENEDEAQMPTVVVRPDGYLYESDRQLDDVKHKLPGADDAARTKLDLVDRTQRYFERRQDPNAIAEDTQKTMLKVFEPANNNP
ncbi:hypothetical protein [Solimonas flava]|uniref:hypothetical protein n=1 Tax=Solimonas flava TaxID=415849 RepID=UPI00040C704A|nr:hypothetical protein [Solimonas flava]